jgi:bifunctional DNA-binding transcriptional regulator/antitoxin component of YhaV-PrlF toxin-antitoxin module
MPQLERGGKYVFGWSQVSENGVIVIPGEAVGEYGLNPGTEVVLISGSKSSGGLVMAIKSVLK